MRIDWREKIPQVTLLPKRHPTGGLLAKDEGLDHREVYGFSSRPGYLPPGRTIKPRLADRLAEWHREMGAPPAAFESLRLLREGAGAVVTGQQAGLLGGPFLTILKCLTAIAVARRLTAETGRPHVPVFWAETDDHDYMEANRAVTLSPDGEVRSFSLPWPAESREGPTGALPVGGDAAAVVESFFAVSGSTEFTPALREGLLADLEAAGTFGLWFSRQILGLLGHHGLLVLDSLAEGSSSVARDLWVRVLDDPLELTNILRQRGEELAAKGFRPVLSKKKKRAPFFLIAEGRRRPVFFERGSFRSGERTFTPLELRRRLEDRPGDFSAAVNLRPLLQDTLLPTAVYVGGPTELAYFQQVLPGYAWAGLPMPALLFRAGASFIEPAVRRFLDKRDIDPADLRKGIDVILGAAVRKNNRLAEESRWEKLRESVLRPLDRLGKGLEADESEVLQQIAKTRGKADFLVRELEKKTVTILKGRSEEFRGQLERTANRLFPTGALQERLLSPWYFLNKYGPSFFDDVLTDLPSDFTAHWFGTIIP